MLVIVGQDLFVVYSDFMDLPVSTLFNQTLSDIIGSRNEFSAWRFAQSRRKSGVPHGVLNAVLLNTKFRYVLEIH